MGTGFWLVGDLNESELVSIVVSGILGIFCIPECALSNLEVGTTWSALIMAGPSLIDLAVDYDLNHLRYRVLQVVLSADSNDPQLLLPQLVTKVMDYEVIAAVEGRLVEHDPLDSL